MCLILIAHNMSENLPLLVLANRDEYYNRPTAAAAPWDECREVIAGRDLVSGGTWFGASGTRWASVTNVREGIKHSHSHRSRGWLVRDYLQAEISPQEFLVSCADQVDTYAGFNLLLGKDNELWYCSNRGPLMQKLKPGIYGLSNHLLDSPWPKVLRGKEAILDLIAQPDLDVERAFALLADTSRASDKELPETGIPLEWERALSAAFISFKNYGTRCSTLLMNTGSGHHHFIERSFAGGQNLRQERRFSW